MFASLGIRGIFAIIISLGFALTPVAGSRAFAQFSQPQGDKSTVLRPPAGARVAIVEFEDLECPDCARAYPLLKQASAKYNIPWVKYDFPLQMHVWSKQAAINARWFDTKSKKLGDDYREAIFANQISIATQDDLRSFTERFSNERKVAFPFAVDPQGKLVAEVEADYALGERVGILHTPTIWVVTNRTGGAPAFIEITDRNKLYDIIDQALAATKPVPTHTTTASAKH
jgi:protein-disulfide isomerase